MTVCNACRYCEAYCPVFQAMENRTSFAKGDLTYLANLCHNCGECLYACQYAPPHEFGINVPTYAGRSPARIVRGVLLAPFHERHVPEHQRAAVARDGSIVSMIVVWLFTRSPNARSDFYAVIPHDVMVGIFGLAGSLIVVSLTIGLARSMRIVQWSGASTGRPASYRRCPDSSSSARHRRGLHA